MVSDRQNGLFLFHFPIELYRNTQNSSATSNTPFINEHSKIIYPSNDTKNLFFHIYNSKGAAVYSNESIKDWINIPLSLSAGGYFYLITNIDNETLSNGKFVIIK